MPKIKTSAQIKTFKLFKQKYGNVVSAAEWHKTYMVINRQFKSLNPKKGQTVNELTYNTFVHKQITGEATQAYKLAEQLAHRAKGVERETVVREFTIASGRMDTLIANLEKFETEKPQYTQRTLQDLTMGKASTIVELKQMYVNGEIKSEDFTALISLLKEDIRKRYPYNFKHSIGS